MQRNTILVLEDNMVTLKGMRYQLQAAGYEVIGATTTNEALEAVRGQHPDLLILDLTLLAEDPFNGVTDGFAFKRWLETSFPDLNLPVIIHTADTSPNLESRAVAQGISRVVHKGTGLEELLDAVHEVLGEPAF